MASHKRCTSKSVEWYVGTRSHFTLVRRRKVIIAYWGVRVGNDDDGEVAAAAVVGGGMLMAVGRRIMVHGLLFGVRRRRAGGRRGGQGCSFPPYLSLPAENILVPAISFPILLQVRVSRHIRPRAPIRHLHLLLQPAAKTYTYTMAAATPQYGHLSL